MPIAHPPSSLGWLSGFPVWWFIFLSPLIHHILYDQKLYSAISRALLSRDAITVSLQRTRLCMTKTMTASFVLLFLKKAFSVFQNNNSSCLRTCTLTSINVYFNFFFFPLASYLLRFLFYLNLKKKKNREII